MQPMENQQSLVPDDILYDLGSGFCTDPEGLTITIEVTLVDGSNLPSFITWTEANNTLYVDTHNDHAGTYTIKISC